MFCVNIIYIFLQNLQIGKPGTSEKGQIGSDGESGMPGAIGPPG